MAPKRSAPPPPPPAASDEETASGSGSEESEEEEEEIAYSPPPAAPKTMAPPPQKGQESEEDEEEDEEEEEEDEEEEEGNTIQVPSPLATKNPPPPPPNREESESSGEDEEEDTDEDDEKPQPQPAPNKVAEGKGAKSSLTEDKKAAVPFQRTWSPEDEVRILEAMAAHRRKHGTLPHVEALAATLDGTLDNTDRSVASLQGKLRNMKRRYTLAAKKGEPPSKDHDRRLFDLSKTVWGSTAAAANGAPAANGGAWREDAEMCKLYPFLAEEVMELRKSYKGLFKREFGMIDDDKARALDEKIRKQRLHQAKLNMNRFDLMKEVTKTLLDLSNTSSRP